MEVINKHIVTGEYCANILIHDTSKALIITFDNAGEAKPFYSDDVLTRNGWSFEFVKKQGFNVIAFIFAVIMMVAIPSQLGLLQLVLK